jgi:hypothetical protein
MSTAEILDTQLDVIPLGIRSTGTYSDVARDFLSRLWHTLRYVAGCTLVANSNGTAVSTTVDLLAGHCLVIKPVSGGRGRLVPMLSAANVSNKQLRDYVDALNLPGLVTGISSNEVTFADAGGLYQWDGPQATLDLLFGSGVVHPGDAVAGTLTSGGVSGWAINTIGAWQQHTSGAAFSWGVLQDADGGLFRLIKYSGGVQEGGTTQSAGPCFDDPWQQSDFFNSVKVSVYDDAPTNTTSGSWSAPTFGGGAKELRCDSRWLAAEQVILPGFEDPTTIKGPLTTGQFMPPEKAGQVPAMGRPMYGWFVTRDNGAVLAFVSRAGDGFLPDGAMAICIWLTDYVDGVDPRSGVVGGMLSLKQEAQLVPFSSTRRVPGMSKLVSFGQVVGSDVSTLANAAFDQKIFFGFSQLRRFNDYGTPLDDIVLAGGPPATMFSGGLAKLASGLGGFADLFSKLFSDAKSAIVSLLGIAGVGDAEVAVSHAATLQPRLDPISGEAIEYEIPLVAPSGGVETFLRGLAPAPGNSRNFGTLKHIRWAPPDLADGTTINMVAREPSSGAYAIADARTSDWDLSSATLSLTGDDGQAVSINLSGVDSPSALATAIKAKNVPGIGLKLRWDDQQLLLTCRDKLTVSAGGTFAAKTGLAGAIYYGGIHSVKVGDCWIPAGTRQALPL